MTTSQIFFCGDTHGHFDHVITAVLEHHPAALVFVGDMQAQHPLDEILQPILNLTSIWWIPGNHDTDSDADYDHLFGSALADRNLHGRVVEVAGVRLAGLGGIFRGQVWLPPKPARYASSSAFAAQCGKGNLWRGGLPRKHRSSIFPADYAHLASQQADILVTHEAPSCHLHGFAAIDELARSLSVSLTIHGHHHDQPDYTSERGRLGFEALSVGFCGIRDQYGDVIVRLRES